MVLEATMVCVDNSEWMRNGDLNPSRFEAQSEAISLLAGQRTQDNPENTVGVLSLAGKSPRVLVTPTPDLGKVLSVMHELSMEGETNVCSGVQVAQLALKHRQNKNQRQRIVLFVGSPVQADQAQLVKIGKKLKKNNVAIDVVAFGSVDEENTTKLQALLDAVNSNDNSHLIIVPDGAVLADCLLSSAVFAGEDGMPLMGVPGSAAGGEGYEYGVDPNLDPELALALRVSMEEERARQEAAAKKEGGGEEASSGVEAGEASQLPASVPMPDAGASDMVMDDDALLQQALAMSMSQTNESMEGVQEVAAPTPQAQAVSNEDAELALAIQMSIADAAGEGGEAAPAPDASMSQVLGDASFMNSVLASLPGVDPNDPSVREMLESLGAQQGQNPDEKKEEDKSNSK
mmetsp:Transcript_23280/g.32158  ORF Transcript_23280/g.32158 Transcript_23280/m.32158 type:complete len:403 (-) Transcript_23280:50-1258(-)|eukprot:CAMPEP_0196579204 /NCGR_PEP_ID=MMETSP1081-20130531/18786_1 /TAXON_ID=36882 /ORGANISM="Pyramimonas amylifera, Strain CCMP720" /LENGTH=402 /DNA_ID=CAMNT_0041898705 /DNA_START=93 /DNA_END=1301 /DNA_ORIENTATION=+